MSNQSSFLIVLFKYIFMKEIWKDVPWYEWNYQVSNLWQVKSLKLWKERILKPSDNSHWYLILHLYKNKKAICKKVHRLVLLWFKWDSKLHCNHKNWDRTDNRLINLEYCTRSENERHKFHTLWYRWSNFWKYGINSNGRTVKVDQYDLDKNFIKTWDSISDVYRELDIIPWNISKVCKWERRKAGNFIWKYT